MGILSFLVIYPLQIKLVSGAIVTSNYNSVFMEFHRIPDPEQDLIDFGLNPDMAVEMETFISS